MTTVARGAWVTTVPEDWREVPLRIEGMDVEPDGYGREFLPDRGRILYRRWLGQDWRVFVVLSGPRVLRSGVVSTRSRADRTYWMPGDAEADRYPTRREVPEFLREFVEQYWPVR